MPYTVELAPAASKQLRNLDRTIQARIVARLEKLKQEPRPTDVAKLKASEDFYRVRVGDYRIIYQIFDGRLIILVVKIGNRRDVYR